MIIICNMIMYSARDVGWDVFFRLGKLTISCKYHDFCRG